jgi:uncharacterized protein YndB with AHSA1/START domain
LKFTSRAERELLASRQDVWGFLEEPRHLADWWPDVASVTPDKRGLASGARWQLRRGSEPGLLRRPNAESTLVVGEVDRPRRATWHITAERLDVELELEATAPERTLARLVVSGPFVLGFRRTLPRTALARLHSLIQTAASL